MATILRDADIERLLGKVIKNGSKDNIRPNSYIIRLGSEGEFLGTGKQFELGESRKQRKGIKLPPGHSVGVSSIEEIDFSQKTVDELYPGHALHGFLAPTTDLSREGVAVSSTQIDAGFCGSLNWTLTNTSSQERRYVYGEKLFRLTIFMLDENEVPQALYSGSYQEKTGYVRSTRKGAPVGMQESEWEEPFTDGGIEESLDRLMKAGYPWQAVATHLRKIDDQFNMVSDEYQKINESIESINTKVDGIESSLGQTINESISKNIESTINNAVKDGITHLYNWAIVRLVGAMAVVAGLAIAVFSTPTVLAFISRYGIVIALAIILVGVAVLIFSRPKKSKND